MIKVTNDSSITSKRPARMLTGLRSVQTHGCKVMLEDGRWYVDWQMGLHGAIYGYRPGWWIDAIRWAADESCANSFGCRDERIVAEMLGEFYPDIEAVRFMLNGSDPCAAAVKLARAVTGRDKILVYGYHGTCSAYASPPTAFDADDNRRGTLEAEREAFVPLGWTDRIQGKTDQYPVLGLPQLRDELAAVIVECPPIDGGREKAAEWLHWLATWAHTSGALFVLDEVVTGFRYGPGGAAEYYGLQGLVDLYCFGKTLGNGYPVAALAGKQAIMKELAGEPGKGLVHYSGTFFAEPIGMAVARAFLRQLREEPPWDYLRYIGEVLVDNWNLLGTTWKLQGHPTRPVLVGDKRLSEDITPLRRHLFARGHIVVEHPWYVSTATDQEDIDSLLENFEYDDEGD